MSLCHNLRFSKIPISLQPGVIEFRDIYNNEWYAPSGCKDIGIRKYEFVAKIRFLCDLEISCSFLFRFFLPRILLLTLTDKSFPEKLPKQGSKTKT